MDKTKILELITQAKPILGTRFGVTQLALFGSFARETDRPGSDIDILVDFDGKVDADRYFGVLFFLEDLLKKPIDLVTREGLRPEYRSFMEKDAIYA